MMQLLLYTRRGCHLCEEAEDILAALIPSGSLKTIDIDGDAELQQKYGIRVPVLVADGGVVMEGRFDEAELVRRLR